MRGLGVCSGEPDRTRRMGCIDSDDGDDRRAEVQVEYGRDGWG